MIYIAGAVFVVFGLFMISPMLFPSRKIREHTGVPKAVFTSQLSSEGVPISISSAVYDFYKGMGYSKTFSPSPEMDIKEILDQEPEDIDDSAIDLLKELHLHAPSESDRESWFSDRDIRTADDMARWLYWASQHQPD